MPISSAIHRVLVLLTLCLAACGRNGDATKDALTLTIITPHGSDIRREFAEAFSAWHQQHHGQPVVIEWPDVGGGGTGNIVRTLDAAYAHSDTSGNDLIFGGGSAAFGTFASKGYLVPLPAYTEQKDGSPLPDPVQRVPKDIFGGALHGKDKEGRGVWVAATMSAFGMAINKDLIGELGLPTPHVWEDIAQPAWFGKLSLADPSKSGSVKTSYEMIFQQYGWEKGWSVMTRLFANAAMVRDNGGAPADDVGSAEAVAGIAIDFYGRLAAVRAGEKIEAFVIPEGGTVLDADPIGLLKGAPNAEVAERFIRFVVSPEGQKIWILRAGAPGGPRRSSLGRLSVLEELYKTEGANLFDPKNPFDPGGGKALKMNSEQQRARNVFMGDLIKAALIDNHGALVRARRAVKESGDRADLMDKLVALPTYRAAQVQGGTLTDGDVKVIGESEQSAVALEWSPPKDDPRGPIAERIQNNLKDRWRQDFAQRFAEVERAARR